MQVANKTNFLQKLSLVLFCTLALGYLIFIGQDILVPIAFAVLLAVLLLPVNKWMERKGFSRITAIMISLFFSILCIAVIVYFLYSQIAYFMDDLPKIKRQLNTHLRSLQRFIYQQFNLTRTEQTKALNDATQQIQGDNGSIIGQTFITITESLVILILLPIYTFLVLFYRDMIRNFIVNVFHTDHKEKVLDALKESRLIVQSYMVGLIIEMGIVAAINVSGFLIFGIKYAFFLGILAAILNLIPYIGMLIASVFCMLVTVTTSPDLSQVIYVLLVLVVVQFFDNNIIMPKIVGAKVKINALATILGVLVGGAIAGISGMFLSIPVIAIMKVIFDRVDGLRPWGEILGDDLAAARKEKRLKRLSKLKKLKT